MREVCKMHLKKVEDEFVRKKGELKVSEKRGKSGSKSTEARRSKG